MSVCDDRGSTVSSHRYSTKVIVTLWSVLVDSIPWVTCRRMQGGRPPKWSKPRASWGFICVVWPFNELGTHNYPNQTLQYACMVPFSSNLILFFLLFSRIQNQIFVSLLALNCIILIPLFFSNSFTGYFSR